MAIKTLKCETCGAKIVQGGNRPKKYCNSTCRSTAWHRTNSAAAAVAQKKMTMKSPGKLVTLEDLNKASTGKTKDLTKPAPKSNYVANNLPPERMKGENAIDFAARKNEWKRKQSKA